MKEFTIGKNDAGQRLDRFVSKSVPLLPAALLQKYIRDSAGLWNDRVDSLNQTVVGCVVGTHAGPGAVAVAFFSGE